MSAVQQQSAAATTEAYLDLHAWGTPQMCIERIRQTTERMRSNTFTSVFSYAGMPYDEAERNLRLFAREVLPALRQEQAVAAG